MHNDELGGVVEGFYGQQWTQAQRLALFDQMVDCGLNTYFYSPKDDLKHRALWRSSYDENEIDALRTLVAACNEHGLNFIYGLSPGLDIRFSEDQEQETIRDRFRQMIEIGVQQFALLFDDLPGRMTDEDTSKFASVASAQAYVTNATFAWLKNQVPESRMLFCPTPYCDRMVKWELGGADYLDTIGNDLASEIDVLWTGPEIISQDINRAALESVTQRIKRQPVIWDNLHANDYDLRRLFCGPYSRSPDLRESVRGILTNPNNEFPVNYIPIRTLGEYLNNDDYDPRSAFTTAAQDWARQYETIHGAISAEDVTLLADCYYLPYSNGAHAETLKAHVDVILNESPDTWGDSYNAFSDLHKRVVGIFGQLTQLRNRELFYAWSRRIWELREELDLI
ncbi:MAG: beta-N-acetylglucosaminidase domain-containing protein, partial [Planctomycetales bacterium]|nr:beta-N-acetylglucosaminidase domain-containing protein [Planctomycetales bacterium]